MKMPYNLSDRQKTSLALASFALLVLVFYGNTLGNGFIYDDHQQVEQNEALKSFAGLPSIITGCVWEGAFGSCKDRGIAYYRPAQSLSYFITFHVGGTHPGVFHFFNLLYFFLAASLVFLLARELLKDILFGFFAAIVFLTHPLNSEAVNWISGAPELLFSVFALAATLFYLKDRSASSKKNSAAVFGRKNFFISVACYFFAMLAKEPALLLPGLFLFLDVVIFHMPFERLMTTSQAKRYAAYAGAAILYLALRFFALGGLTRASGFYESFSLSERVYAFFTLFAQYIEKFFYPIPLLFYYTFEKNDALLSTPFLVALVVVLTFGGIFIVALRFGKNALAFGLLWIVLFLLPVLVFLESLNEALFAERYAFIPSVGFALCAAFVLISAWRAHRTASFFVGGTLFAIGIACLVLVHARNEEWKSDESLYPATLAINERAYPIRFNWAVYLRNQKNDFEAAKKELETILTQNPQWHDNSLVYLHLGDYAREVQHDEQKALSLYKMSVQVAMDWKSSFAYDRLGSFYAQRKEYTNAIPYFCRASNAGGPSAATSDEHLQRAMDLAVSHYKEAPEEFFHDITEGGVFQKSANEGVRYNRTACTSDTCSIFFFLAGKQEEVILPFLITANDTKGKYIAITNMSRSPQGDQAMLDVNPRYKDEKLTFIFPTCEGAYYEVATSSK